MLFYTVLAVVTFLIVIYPVMLAARIVGAKRTGFVPVVFALLLQAILGMVISQTIPDEIAGGLVAVIAGTLIYSWVLQTTVLRGFAIIILTLVIFVGVVLLLSVFFSASQTYGN